MAKYTKVTLTGTLYWCKVFEFNRNMTDHTGALVKSKPVELVSDEDAGAYEIEIHVSKEELAKLKKSGARQSPKKDKDTGFPIEFEDGYALRLRRFHLVPKAPKAGGAPKVVHADGRAWNPEQDEDGLIWNGSEGKIEVLVQSFPVTIQGKAETATRTVLEKVIVTKQAPRPSEDGDEAESAARAEKAAPKGGLAVMDDDDIPF